MSDELKHYGTPRRSGRYPWGSGDDGYQRAIGWRGHIEELRKQGMSDVEIAKNEGISFKKFNEYDWFYVLNMIYSDFYKVFVNNTNLYVKTALEWLNDIDVKSGKAYRYYIKVVK